MLLGTFGPRLLGNLLTDTGTIRASEGTIRAGQNFCAASFFNRFWNTKVLSKRT